jgi:hypothetical protein
MLLYGYYITGLFDVISNVNPVVAQGRHVDESPQIATRVVEDSGATRSDSFRDAAPGFVLAQPGIMSQGGVSGMSVTEFDWLNFVS